MARISKAEKKKRGKGRGKTRTKIKAKGAKKKYKDPYIYDSVTEWTWREFSSSKKVDPFVFIEKYKDWRFFIGTDSHSYSKSGTCVYTTVLIAHNRMVGGAVIRYTDKRAFVPFEALSAKLMVETQRSIAVCQMVEEELIELSTDENDYSENLVGVSIDVNRDTVHASGKYKEALVGMVVGYGYNAFIKPDAWAASSVADAKC